MLRNVSTTLLTLKACLILWQFGAFLKTFYEEYLPTDVETFWSGVTTTTYLDGGFIVVKKLSTTKFYNILRPTTFIFVGFPSEVVWKIRILNFLNSDVVFVDKMTSNQKVANYKIL